MFIEDAIYQLIDSNKEISDNLYCMSRRAREAAAKDGRFGSVPIGYICKDILSADIRSEFFDRMDDGIMIVPNIRAKADIRDFYEKLAMTLVQWSLGQVDWHKLAEVILQRQEEADNPSGPGGD